MIIADENIDFRIIYSIRKLDITVYSVFEENRGIMDIEIIEFSRNPPRIILTRDKDFGEWVFQNGIRDISVVFLRYEFTETYKIIEILKNLFVNSQNELFGKFTTVTTQKIRSRKI
jgi:predicted nuclease of predicted toxin-antitoxin system